MTEKTKIFLKKEKIDIAFSVLSFILFAVLYFVLGALTDKATGARGDGSSFLLVIIMWGILMGCLGINIFVQAILNIDIVLDIESVKNKIKSYVFFIALNIDVLYFHYILFVERWYSEKIFLLSFAFIFIKFLIAKYYYKTLNKINTL